MQSQRSQLPTQKGHRAALAANSCSCLAVYSEAVGLDVVLSDQMDFSQIAAMFRVEPQLNACKSNPSVISCSPYTTIGIYNQLLLALCHAMRFQIALTSNRIFDQLCCMGAAVGAADEVIYAQQLLGQFFDHPDHHDQHLTTLPRQLPHRLLQQLPAWLLQHCLQRLP